MTKNLFVGLFLKKGRLTWIGELSSMVLGILLIYLSVKFLPFKILKLVGLSIGVAMVGLGGFSARASGLEIPPPFTNDPMGWREAKKTYHEINLPPSEKN